MESFDSNKNLKRIKKLKDSEGKSGSVFFYTHDNKFILKTISDKEKILW